MPRTDPRLLAYTPEQAYIEYLEDAIEDDRILIGGNDKPIRKITYKGVEIYETGDEMFDAMEREWADQDLDALENEHKKQLAASPERDRQDLEEYDDILEALAAKADDARE